MLSPNTRNQGGTPNTGPQPTIGRTSGTATSGLPTSGTATSEAYGSNLAVRNAKNSQEQNSIEKFNPFTRSSKFGPNVG